MPRDNATPRVDRPGKSAGHGEARLVRRQRVVIAVAALCAALSTSGLAAAAMVKSPEQVAAETRAPRASVLTATVERRVLASTLVTRGTATAATRVEVSPLSSTQGAGQAVVTALRTAVGREVEAGDVLLEVSGRPLVALPGATPAYRDLKPADEGHDVAEVQEALRKLGHYDGGDPRGRFGAETKRAVRRFYDRIGYDVPTTAGADPQAERQALVAARDAVDAATREVNNVRRRMAAAAGQPPAPGEEPLSVQLRYAKVALERAKEARDELVARTGPTVPLAEVVLLSSFPARVAQLTARVGDPVEAPLIVLSAGRLDVLARLQPDQADLVKPGLQVEIVAETLGEQASGRIASVGAVSTEAERAPAGSGDRAAGDGEDQAGSPYVPVVIRPSKALPAAWAGQDVRLTVTAAQTESEVLVVPLSAVSSGADGRTVVGRLGPGGQVVRVEVRAGVSGDGFVEVTPVDGRLAEGDEVAVGEGGGP